MSSKINITGYNKWSEFYDTYPNPTVAIDELTFPHFYQHLNGKNILEVGCGTGRHTARLIQQKNQVVGVDTSVGMLSEARKKISSEELILSNADILKDKIPNAPFDAAIMSLVLEHISDLDLFFKKVKNLLKPGASLYFSEIHPDRAQSGILAHFKQTDGSDYHLESVAHSDEEIKNAANKFGFQVKTQQTICGTPSLVSMNPKWSKYLDQPMIQIWVISLS